MENQTTTIKQYAVYRYIPVTAENMSQYPPEQEVVFEWSGIFYPRWAIECLQVFEAPLEETQPENIIPTRAAYQQARLWADRYTEQTGEPAIVISESIETQNGKRSYLRRFVFGHNPAEDAEKFRKVSYSRE
ncbi:MAG TPA: hypothetical protein VGE97_08280 [Nitrososphaera sp.]